MLDPRTRPTTTQNTTQIPTMKPTDTRMPASGTGWDHEPSPIASPLAHVFPLLGFPFLFFAAFFTFSSSILFFCIVILLQGCEDPQIPPTVRPSSIRATKPPKPLYCRLAAPINKLGNNYHQYCSSSNTVCFGWGGVSIIMLLPPHFLLLGLEFQKWMKLQVVPG